MTQIPICISFRTLVKFYVVDRETDEVLKANDVVTYVFCLIGKTVNIRNFNISTPPPPNHPIPPKKPVKIRSSSVIGKLLVLVYCNLSTTFWILF